MKKDKWIQDIHTKKGALHKQLGIPAKKPIPTKVLHDVVGAKVGTHVHGTTVTPLLKKRSNLALTLRRKKE